MEHTKDVIPEKLMYKVAEVCQITDTQPYVLRFWESEFPQLASEKNRSGQRVYRRQDIDLILRIKKLLYEEEFTLAGARKVLETEPSQAEIVPPGRGRGKKAAAHEEEAAPEAPPQATARQGLFGESRPEAPASTPSSDEARYRALYEEALHTIDSLRGELATAVETRETVRERARRVATKLQSVLEI